MATPGMIGTIFFHGPQAASVNRPVVTALRALASRPSQSDSRTEACTIPNVNNILQVVGMLSLYMVIHTQNPELYAAAEGRSAVSWLMNS